MQEKLDQVQQFFELEEDQRRQSQPDRPSIPARQARSRKAFAMGACLRDAIQRSVIGDFEDVISFGENLLQFKSYLAAFISSEIENGEALTQQLQRGAADVLLAVKLQ